MVGAGRRVGNRIESGVSITFKTFRIQSKNYLKCTQIGKCDPFSKEKTIHWKLSPRRPRCWNLPTRIFKVTVVTMLHDVRGNLLRVNETIQNPSQK